MKYGRRAIVIGGGHSGLTAARVLADYFEEVLILEKDAAPNGLSARKGVPQGTHVHGLQGHALKLLNHYYPNIENDLVTAGAVSLDFGAQVRLYLANGWMPQRSSGQTGLSMTRPLLESKIREHTLAKENISIEWNARVTGLTITNEMVSGVEYSLPSGQQHKDSALVIDASGRGTRVSRWLADAGLPAPSVSSIHVDVRYATSLYERPAGKASETGYVIRHYPINKLGAAMLPIENNQWLLSLSGRFGVYPGKTPVSFLASTASLPVPDISQALANAKATTDVSSYTFSHNEMRQYHEGLPIGLIPLGDCVIALNPLYGQGMTSAIVQADLLHQSLSTLQSSSFNAQALADRHGPVVNAFSAPPWKRSVLGDTIFNEATGDIPKELEAWRKDERALNQLAASDPKVAALLFQVSQFAEPPEKLSELLRSAQ